MLKCWHLDPKRRPAFSELFSVLERILEADDAEASSAPTSSPLSSTTSSPHQRPPLASDSSMAAYGPGGGGMLSTSGPVSTRGAGVAGDAEDESGEGSGSVDLAANMWADTSRHASGVVGSPTTAAKNENGGGGRGGKSESGERTRSGRKASREDNGRAAMRELGGSMAEYGSGGGEADTWPAIAEREGSTIEQIMRDTTRMTAEDAPIVPVRSPHTHDRTRTRASPHTHVTHISAVQEMELRFKEELARGDARACPCMIRVGAHVWCGAPGGRVDIYHAMVRPYPTTRPTTHRACEECKLTFFCD
jgi:hypothetical protein